MNKITITIATTDGDRIIEALVISPGLAINHDPSKLYWNISHIPSGTRIMSVLTRWKAIEIAEHLAVLANWARVKNGKLSKRLKNQVARTVLALMRDGGE